jgi:hypothetical protein
MAFAHSFPIDGAKPRDDDALSNEYPGPFDLTAVGGMSRARRSARIVVSNGSFSICVRSTTSIVFTRPGAEVDMSCSIFCRSPRQDRWSANPRLGLVLNIAIRLRDLAPRGLPTLAAVFSLLLDMDPQERQRRSGTGTCVGRDF